MPKKNDGHQTCANLKIRGKLYRDLAFIRDRDPRYDNAPDYIVIVEDWITARAKEIRKMTTRQRRHSK